MLLFCYYFLALYTNVFFSPNYLTVFFVCFSIFHFVYFPACCFLPYPSCYACNFLCYSLSFSAVSILLCLLFCLLFSCHACDSPYNCPRYSDVVHPVKSIYSAHYFAFFTSCYACYSACYFPLLCLSSACYSLRIGPVTQTVIIRLFYLAGYEHGASAKFQHVVCWLYISDWSHR
jgi:hypothetical protein